MGDAQSNLVEPGFTRSIHVQSVDQRLTSIAGAILLRDAEHRLGLINSIAQDVVDPHDPRDPRRIRDRIGESVRERAFSLALGQSARDGLDRLDDDPAFRAAFWNLSGDQGGY